MRLRQQLCGWMRTADLGSSEEEPPPPPVLAEKAPKVEKAAEKVEKARILAVIGLEWPRIYHSRQNRIGLRLVSRSSEALAKLAWS